MGRPSNGPERLVDPLAQQSRFPRKGIGRAGIPVIEPGQVIVDQLTPLLRR